MSNNAQTWLEYSWGLSTPILCFTFPSIICLEKDINYFLDFGDIKVNGEMVVHRVTRRDENIRANPPAVVLHILLFINCPFPVRSSFESSSDARTCNGYVNSGYETCMNGHRRTCGRAVSATV